MTTRAKNTIDKAQLAALTNATPAKKKRATEAQYKLVEQQCQRPGCERTFRAYPKAHHPYCSLDCIAAMEPEFFTTTMRHWALGG